VQVQTRESEPLDPGFPYGLLALWLIGKLLVGDDLFQLGEHLSPDHHAKTMLDAEIMLQHC
jgi:hypothetical protein